VQVEQDHEALQWQLADARHPERFDTVASDRIEAISGA
jgi:hypothetical protein